MICDWTCHFVFRKSHYPSLVRLIWWRNFLAFCNRGIWLFWLRWICGMVLLLGLKGVLLRAEFRSYVKFRIFYEISILNFFGHTWGGFLWWVLLKIREVFWGRRIKIPKIFFSLHFKGFKRFLSSSFDKISEILGFYKSRLTVPRSNWLRFQILNQFCM